MLPLCNFKMIIVVNRMKYIKKMNRYDIRPNGEI